MIVRLIKILGLLLLLAVLLLAAVYGWFRWQLAKAEQVDNFEQRFFSSPAVASQGISTQRERCNDYSNTRNAYFGELHIHSAISHDSSSFGNVADASAAYDFARGLPLEIRMRSDASDAQPPVVKLKRPLDFAAVTDHAENFGETHLCLMPGSEAYSTGVCKLYRGDIRLPVSDEMQPLMRMLGLVIFGNQRSRQVCGSDGLRCINAASDIWRSQQRVAEQAYDRSADCGFTSFIGYEYSLAVQQTNLHRNVIFANATVPPLPLSSKDADQPEQLWAWLESQCIDSGTGCDALAIPHNSNWSSGRMFYPLSLQAIDSNEQQRLAALRKKVEPLVEIMQVKGDSECRNGLDDVVGAYDELCDFEKLREVEEASIACGDEVGSGGMSLSGCISRYSYVRPALTQGLKEQQALNVNPFEFGIIAATDNHTGAAGAVDEKGFPGSTGMDREPARRLSGPKIVPGVAKGNPSRYNPGGLAGVWAEENSRESLFAAMKRRETFGTSGPRIAPRFFAGWDLDPTLCDAPDRINRAYRSAVPMGSVLASSGLASTGQAQSPAFFVSAAKDAMPGASRLLKLQVVKGWVDSNGQLNQQVYDIAGDAEAAQTLDTNSCSPLTSGYDQLCTVWRDSDFNQEQGAVYYARVVENPSCRWSRYDCLNFAADQQPAACSDPALPTVIQERAWTSPIWYYPDK